MGGERGRERGGDGRRDGRGMLGITLRIAGIHKTLYADTNSHTHLVGNKPRHALRQIIIIPSPLENAHTDPTDTYTSMQ